MNTKKPILYVNRFSGSIIQVSMFQIATLSEDWSRVRFIKDHQGKPVMRMELNGATVDISENKLQEMARDGNQDAE